MALVEVYGGQRSLAFELATADNCGNGHSNCWKWSDAKCYCSENIEDGDAEDEICVNLTWSPMFLKKKTVYWLAFRCISRANKTGKRKQTGDTTRVGPVKGYVTYYLRLLSWAFKP